MTTPTIQFDASGESQVFDSSEGRVFFRRDEQGTISVCDEGEGLPVFGEFVNVYVTFESIEAAEAFARDNDLTVAED